MLDGKTKSSIVDRKITFLGLAAIIATLACVNFSEPALAYAADDPGVVYSCFETNEDGSYVTQTNNETGQAELVPCDVTSDHAWMLTASALVLMMTPAGLAMFYGGLSRQKNAVNTLMMVFITTGVIAVQFALWGVTVLPLDLMLEDTDS